LPALLDALELGTEESKLPLVLTHRCFRFGSRQAADVSP